MALAVVLTISRLFSIQVKGMQRHEWVHKSNQSLQVSEAFSRKRHIVHKGNSSLEIAEAEIV